jgi:hypothetical protein
MNVARTWGSTADDRARGFPCDRHVTDGADAWFRAIDVDAPAPVLFRWLCQLRVAPYSYDWIDNGGRTSPRTPTPGLERLAVGQRVMSIFELVEFEPDRHLTLVLRSNHKLFGRIAVTYAVLPRGERASRLVVKLLVQAPASGVLGRAWRALGPWLDLVMMRKQLYTLKALAERG